MNWTAAEKIGRAVLYEGYLLYPYRASALKNRQRSMLGIVPSGASTGLECLFEGSMNSSLAVRLKFLQESERSAEERDVLLDSVRPGEARRPANPRTGTPPVPGPRSHKVPVKKSDAAISRQVVPYPDCRRRQLPAAVPFHTMPATSAGSPEAVRRSCERCRASPSWR